MNPNSLRAFQVAAGLFLAFLALTLNANARVLRPVADERVPAAEPTPAPMAAKVARENGKPFTITWADGREAVLKVSSVDSTPLKSTFQITDNTCTDRQNMRCTYGFSVRSFWLSLVWTKNSDASRVGETVEQGFMSPGSPTAFYKFEVRAPNPTGLSRRKFPDANAGLPDHEISCRDFSWLPGRTKDAPAKVLISRWDGEDNLPNPETGFNENRTAGGALNVHLERSGPQSMRVTGVDVFTSVISEIALTVFATQSLTIEGPNGEICQVGIASNLQTEVIAEFTNLESKRPPLASVEPYIVGSDEILNMPEVKQAFGSALQILENSHSFSNVVYR